MSVKLMNQVWQIELPTTDKLVLLALANRHNDKTGQCNPDQATLSTECGLGRRQLIRVISRLQEQQLITVKRTSRTGKNSYVLTLDEVTPETPRRSDMEDTCEVTFQTTRSDISSTLRSDISDTPYIRRTKIVEPEEEPKENIKAKPPVDEWKNSDYGFADFWEAYPRKDDRKLSLEKWRRLQPSRDLVSQIVAHLKERVESGMWKPKTEPRFIMQPTKFINGERWNDLILPDKPDTITNRQGYTPPPPPEPPEQLPEFQLLPPGMWDTVLYTFKNEDPDALEAYIQELRPLGIADGVVWIDAGSNFMRNWVARNYQVIIAEKLRAEVKIIAHEDYR